MLFKPKSLGYFVDCNEFSTVIARASSVSAPYAVDLIEEVATGDEAALGELLQTMQPKKGPSGYLQAVCGINPENRVVRCVALDLKKVKEPNYLQEVATTQLRIELDKYALSVLQAETGQDFDPSRGVQKNVVFCGLPSEEVIRMQDGLLAKGIYPERLELGSVASLGAFADYLKFTEAKSPALILELGYESINSYIVSANGVESSRPIPHGLNAVVPLVQKELGLKDEESARKLFFSNTFDFTGMGPLLVKRVIKELQSSIGFYEVQTGQTISQLACMVLPPKLAWLETSIATQLGVSEWRPDLAPWLASHGVSLVDAAGGAAADVRRFRLFSLMVQTKSA